MAHSNRGRSTAVRPAAKRRDSLWIGMDFQELTLTTGGVVAYTLNAAALALRPFTIVRTRMLFQIRSDQAAAIETQVGAFGWSVVSEQAAAIGITAIPTPVTDIGSDLFYFYQLLFGFEQNLTDRTTDAARYVGDSKAMRKVNEDQEPVAVLELSSVGGGFRVLMAGAMLVKLH